MVDGGYDAGDLVQGVIGNCWCVGDVVDDHACMIDAGSHSIPVSRFVAAIAVVAEREDLIRRVVITDTINPKGDVWICGCVDQVTCE